MITLRDYQARDVARIRFSYQSGRRAPLYVAPTGSGKTVLFCYIAKQSMMRGKRVWILVHRKELLHQTSRALAEFGIPHGRILPGSRKSKDMVQVASIQTLGRRLDQYDEPDVVIGDEAHRSRSKVFAGILNYHPRAKLLGTTATPLRLDNLGLGVSAGGVFDDLIVGPTPAELMNLGYLSRAEVYGPVREIDYSRVKKSKRDFQAAGLAAIMDRADITGDAVEHYQKICNYQPAIAFCVNIEHAHHVAEQFSAAGYQAACVDGKSKDSFRAGAIKDLGNGKLHVLTSCEIVSEGTDIPIVSAAIMLRKTMSLSLALQQMGRVLRPYPGKKMAYILDHAGNTLKHGLPDDERYWSLDGDSKQEKDEDEDAISVRQCKNCYRVFKSVLKQCPGCGAATPIKPPRQVTVAPGELVKIEKRKAEMERREEMYRARTFEDLVALGKSKGYKPGWAQRVFDARQEKQSARGQA